MGFAGPVPPAAVLKCCSKCKKEQPLAAFYVDHYRGGHAHPSCKGCCNKAAKKLSRLYGWRKQGIVMTLAEYQKLFDAQKGKCTICGVAPGKKALDVDHDHKTGKARALLCNNCNKGIVTLEKRPHATLAYASKHEIIK